MLDHNGAPSPIAAFFLPAERLSAFHIRDSLFGNHRRLCRLKQIAAQIKIHATSGRPAAAEIADGNSVSVPN
jgi:hypothetical protein